MKKRYHVTYVDNKLSLFSFEVLAANWQELKNAIDEQLPPEAKCVCDIMGCCEPIGE